MTKNALERSLRIVQSKSYLGPVGFRPNLEIFLYLLRQLSYLKLRILCELPMSIIDCALCSSIRILMPSCYRKCLVVPTCEFCEIRYCMLDPNCRTGSCKPG